MTEPLIEDESALEEPVTKGPNVETMTVQEILSFCFPAGKQHCPSTNRLYCVADNGPLWNLHSYCTCLCSQCQAFVRKLRKTDQLAKQCFLNEPLEGPRLLKAWGDKLCANCKLHLKKVLHIRAGPRAKHIVNDLEVGQMTKQVEIDDILVAYHRQHGGSEAEKLQFLDVVRREKSVKDACRNITREEMIAVFDGLLKPIVTDDPLNYKLPYYDVREVIKRHRKERVKTLSIMYPEHAPTKKFRKPKPVPHVPQVGKPPVKLSYDMAKTYGKLEDQRLAHAHNFEMATISDQNNPVLVMNARLLRNLEREENTWKK